MNDGIMRSFNEYLQQKSHRITRQVRRTVTSQQASNHVRALPVAAAAISSSNSEVVPLLNHDTSLGARGAASTRNVATKHTYLATIDRWRWLDPQQRKIPGTGR